MQTDEITVLLNQWGRGDRSALNRLVPLMLPQMRGIARSLRNGQAGHTLETTALVNETYLRFAGTACDAHNRGHFLALVARAMRQILIDYAKSRHRLKRGGAAVAVTLSEAHVLTEPQIEELLQIEQFLGLLDDEHPRRCQVFEMRFYGGFSVEQIAQACSTSENTVIRDYQLACGWLKARYYAVPSESFE